MAVDPVSDRQYDFAKSLRNFLQPLVIQIFDPFGADP